MKATVCKTHELSNGDDLESASEARISTLLDQLELHDDVRALPEAPIEGDDFHALGAFCSHLGAPMAQGLMNDQRVVCPWHMASFDVQTGKQCEPPGLDGLTEYPLIVDGDDIIERIDMTGSSKQEVYKSSDAMAKLGRRCDLVAFEGAEHGFFNIDRGGEAAFRQTLEATEREDALRE